MPIHTNLYNSLGYIWGVEQMTRKDLRNLLVSALLLSQIMTSCSVSTEQEVNRSVRTSDIVQDTSLSISSETSENYTEQVIVPVTSSSNCSETTEPTWGGGPGNKPKEFTINISFSKNLKVFDYGKSTVNVYQARHDTPVDSWGDEWVEYGYLQIQNWCLGNPLSIDGVELFYPNTEVSLENIKRVQTIKLNEIEDWEEISRRTGLKAEDTILCWTYDICDFPQIYSELPYFLAPTDLKEISYARISAQYVDDLPVYGTTSSYGDATFEWEEVVESARIAFETNRDSGRINPSHTCYFEVYRDKYRIEKTLRTDIPVIDPQTCLAEIETAIKYNPLAISGAVDIMDIWEKDIEIYCMELTYVALESNPRVLDGELEESIKLHDVYLVPAWEIYYVITDPKTKQMSCEKVLINATTGKSLYSDSYGPGENTDLYPDLLLPG